MGERAIEQTRRAMRALADADIALADKVIAADDEIDKLEVQIDEEAIRYMTLRGPVASELRIIVVGMKASHDLERVGDEATGIARRSRKLAIELVGDMTALRVALNALDADQGDAPSCARAQGVFAQHARAKVELCSSTLI